MPRANTHKHYPGVGRVAREAILAGMTNAEALEHVHMTLAGVKTTMACISWYRHDLRRRGEDVLTARELKAAREAEMDRALGLDQEAA